MRYTLGSKYFGLIIAILMISILPCSHIMADDFERAKKMGALTSIKKDNAFYVPGAKILYADYERIRLDFLELQNWSNQEIDSWLLENFSYIREKQISLNNIRNTPIPIDENNVKPIYGQPGENRAGAMEATGSA